VLRIIEDERLRERATEVGAYLRQQAVELQKRHSGVIGDLRGIGLFFGIDLVSDVETRAPLDK
jgi:taurine-pyruvate aminotransferase